MLWTAAGLQLRHPKELPVHVACPDCGSEHTITERRSKRQRRFVTSCPGCDAELVATKQKGGAAPKITVKTPGKPKRGAADQTALAPEPVAESSEPVAELPEAAFQLTEPDTPPPILPDELLADTTLAASEDPGFSASSRDETDPDAGPVLPAALGGQTAGQDFGAMTETRAPRSGMSISEDAEIPVGGLGEKTDPGTGIAFLTTNPGRVPKAARDTIPETEREARAAVIDARERRASAPPIKLDQPIAPSSTAVVGTPELRKSKRRSNTESAPTVVGVAGSVSGATSDKTDEVTSAAKAAADSPLTLAMPDPAKPETKRPEVDKLLTEYSMMFRLDNKSKRRRDTALTFAALAITAVAIVVVALSSRTVDAADVRAMIANAQQLEQSRSTRVSYRYAGAGGQGLGDGLGRQVRVSVLAARLARVVHDRIERERPKPAAAVQEAPPVARPVPEPEPPVTAQPEPPVAKPTAAERRAERRRKRRQRQRLRRSKKAKKRRKLPSFE